MSDALPEPPDDQMFPGVIFYSDTLRFLMKASYFYRDLLKADEAAIELDPDLKDLLVEEPRQISALKAELRTVERIIQWHEERKELTGDYSPEQGTLSHGTIRLYKSVGLLYLKHLQQRRNELSLRPNQSKYLLEDVDAQLARYKERLNAGALRRASPRPLLVDEFPTSAQAPARSEAVESPDTEISIAAVREPKARVLESIQILDPTLRERCLDLFANFHESGQHERFDTVVTEASRILEDRMRIILGETGGVTGDRLSVIAFGKDSPKLILSAIPAEQESVMLLFKGLFGYIRNPAHHKLVGTLSPERTLQVLGMIDYAIHLLESATPRPSAPPVK